MKYILIHFTDMSVCLNSIKENNIRITKSTRENIRKIHDAVYIIIPILPKQIMADVCFRAANQILRHIEFDCNEQFRKYKKNDYLY